jgi:predicted Rossmann-fold nucleotide-binding protein
MRESSRGSLQNRLVQEIHDLASLERVLAEQRPLDDLVICGLDLRQHGAVLATRDLRGVVFLGCELEPTDLANVVQAGALIFPAIRGLPYSPWRTTLYTPEELFAGLDVRDRCTYCTTLDARIYKHFRATTSATEPAMLDALAQRLHDHGITQALEAMLRRHDRVVAIMGGHGLSRADAVYLEVARMAGQLAARGFVVATGGGPGAMEAANLGARFAARDDAALCDAVRILAQAPLYTDRDWLLEAARVRTDHEALLASPPVPTLGLPTFFYGHEPPNMFATHHAKYFANCVREDGLVSIATHGIVFAPGSAGTVQEIFQDACQNHYGTVKGLVSSMALLGTRYWTEQLPVVPLLDALAGGKWRDRVLVSDDPAQIVSFLADRGPRLLDRAAWSFCAAYCA